MKVAIATVQVPFVKGGAELMTQGLKRALEDSGHEAEVISIPFRFAPPQELSANINVWLSQDFDTFDMAHIDSVIALKFPAYYLKHHDKKIWLLHQHRAVYELYGGNYGENPHDPNAVLLKEKITALDTNELSICDFVYTISKTVSDRLKRFNNVESSPLYQPPPLADLLSPGDIFPYIFCPSRLEALKRQEILIRAMAHVDKPIYAVISGIGVEQNRYLELVHSLGLEKRVFFTGYVDDSQMLKYYSNCLAVYFGPYHEDYGFITLEAMLSAKPVITFNDSGEPTEFVIDQETGYILGAEPQNVADTINRLWSNRMNAQEMGQAALQRYTDIGISWNKVIEKLTGEAL